MFDSCLFGKNTVVLYNIAFHNFRSIEFLYFYKFYIFVKNVGLSFVIT